MNYFRICLAIIGICLVGNVGRGGFEFNIITSQAVYNSDGVTPVTGYFDVVLILTGADLTSPPTNLRAFNFEYNAPAALGAFSIDSIARVDGSPPSGGLMNGLSFNNSLYPRVLRYGRDSIGSVTAFNNAILGRVNFTTTSGASATYSITPGDAGFNTLINSSAVNLAPTAFGGSIVITAVPEPTSLGLAGLAFGAFAIRRWRQKRKTAAQV